MRQPFRDHLIWLTSVLTLGLAGALVARHFGALNLQPSGWWPWFMYLVLAPCLEEWALRAMLLQELAQWLQRWRPAHAPWLANTLISALFALMHQSVAGPKAWLWFFPSWVLGMTWFKFRSWFICALSHAWFNAALILVSAFVPLHAQATTVNTEKCAMPATLQPAAQATWSGRALRAWVAPQGQLLVLTVSEQTPHRAATCLRSTALLGNASATPPSLRFERALLVLTWHLTTGGQLPRDEVYQFTLDASQPGWPLVRYRHELGSGPTRSGMDARLEQHQASWFQADGLMLHGPLVQQALLPLPQLPHYQAYSPAPLVNKVHR
jgi:Type II CAAX prenyl endopeptidase Rce1-like